MDENEVRGVLDNIIDYLDYNNIDFDEISKEQAESIAAKYIHAVEYQFRGLIDAKYDC